MALLGWVVNILRSFPFIVLMVAIIPLTRAIMGTISGIAGVIPPLVLSIAPFVARTVEQSLSEIPRSSVEAVEACGASIPRIVFSALLPETLPSLIRGAALTLIATLGYIAMAGAFGAGGLGDHCHSLRILSLPDRGHDCGRGDYRRDRAGDSERLRHLGAQG